LESSHYLLIAKKGKFEIDLELCSRN